MELNNDLFISSINNTIFINKQINYKINSINDNINIDLINNIYIDKIIYNYIINNLKCVYNITYNNITINYICNNKKDLKKSKINTIFNIILSLQKLTNNYNSILIYIYTTNFKKQLPNKNNIITPFNINSGLTAWGTFSPPYILIFRDEELYRTLIHEVIHILKCDYNLQNNIYNDIIFNKFNIKDNFFINVNECYTEILTLLIYCIFLHKKYNKSITHFLKLELKHNLLKICQILNLYDIKTLNSNISFEQKSNVLSYFIFKTSLLYNINELLIFLNNNTHNLYIEKNKCNEFVNLIILSTDKLFKDKKFIKLLNTKINYNNNLRFTFTDL